MSFSGSSKRLRQCKKRRMQISKTISGKECQKWSEQKPHRHRFKKVGNHNFCRNPDKMPGVWCYTMDKRKRWEFCDVPKCDKGVNQQDFTHGLCFRNHNYDHLSDTFSPDCQTGTGERYKGKVAKTASGKKCQSWRDQKPHRHKHEEVGEHNFCRNPDNHTGVWCYTIDRKNRWEPCQVPKC